MSRWTDKFGDDVKSNLARYYSTLQLVDVSGDGAADVYGRFTDGVRCAISNKQDSFVSSNNPWTIGFSDQAKWGDARQFWSTITFSDVNGDTKADMCGRAAYRRLDQFSR